MGTVGAHAINVSLCKKTPFDAVTGFAPLTRVANVPSSLVDNPAQPFKTVQELIACTKASAGQVNVGSSRSGSSIHLSGELFKSMGKVAYKGSARP